MATAGECTICLSNFKEAVSIPCGHVYCSQCLTNYVNTTRNNNLTSSCPTCRSSFNIVTPELTYLPGQYHKYIVPSVRRVYIDNPLQAKLAQSEARVKSLEKDKEVLIDQCERHMAAARAHATGEKDAILELQKANDEKEQANEAYERAQDDIDAVYEDFEYLKLLFDKLKRYCRERDEDDIGNQTVKKRKGRARFIQDPPLDESVDLSTFAPAASIHVQLEASPNEDGQISKRTIRPLPQKFVKSAVARRNTGRMRPHTPDRIATRDSD